MVSYHSYHSLHEILRFSAYFDRTFILFMDHSPGHGTMTSHPKWRSADQLLENIHFVSDYSISRFVYAFLFHNSLTIILSEHNV